MNIYVLMDDLIHPTYIGWYIALWDISGMIYIQRCHLFANKNGGLSPNLRGIKKTGIVCGYGTNTMMRYTSKMAICIGKIILLQQSLLGNGNSHVSTWRGVAAFLSTAFFLQLWCADSRVLIQKSHIHFSRPLLFFLGAFVGRSCGQRPKNPWHVWWVQPTGVFYHCGSDRLCVIYFMLLNLICCHCASVG